jgi:hypothetical protein
VQRGFLECLSKTPTASNCSIWEQSCMACMCLVTTLNSVTKAPPWLAVGCFGGAVPDSVRSLATATYHMQQMHP